MDFDIGNPWHWLFVFGATFGSAWHACRVFFTAYESHPLFSPGPFFDFWYELGASMGGWMGLWALWPNVMLCDAAGCRYSGSAWQALLLLLAALCIFGQLPRLIDRMLAGFGGAGQSGGRH